MMASKAKRKAKPTYRFEVDRNFWVRAVGRDGGAIIKQDVTALLLLEILRELRKINKRADIKEAHK